ncbi:MAG: VWA domain-containing protein, partial [Oscillospiraceae bacterium]|nr:VWA domain-containing protein [Oscillospiraceae bacterium]
MKTRKLLAIVLVMAMITALMPMSMVANAATNDAVVFQKELIPAGNGQPARIKLEAYVEGTVSASSGGKPTDIIMVLDQSGSMDDSIAVSDNQSRSKLAIMKDAVQVFAEEVAELNVAGDNRYRIAIAGFASADSNTEILTVGKSKNQIENNVEYSYVEVNGNSLDENENYYIASENGYTEIYYYDGLFIEGWYYGEWYNRTEVNVSNTTVYSRTIVGYPDYRNAFINCTQSNVGANGAITNAVNNLDGNGATRADLGFEMAEKIIEEQPDGTYDN